MAGRPRGAPIDMELKGGRWVNGSLVWRGGWARSKFRVIELMDDGEYIPLGGIHC